MTPASCIAECDQRNYVLGESIVFGSSCPEIECGFEQLALRMGMNAGAETRLIKPTQPKREIARLLVREMILSIVVVDGASWFTKR